MIPLFCAIMGIIFIGYEIVKTARPQDIIDVNVKYMNDDIDIIVSVAQKYEKKVRGSVRMGQGRIKSITEEYLELKEKEITFPDHGGTI